MLLDTQTEILLAQYWGMGFAAGVSIILVVWVVHLFKAASDWGGE